MTDNHLTHVNNTQPNKISLATVVRMQFKIENDDIDEYFKQKCHLLNNSASILADQDKIDLLTEGIDYRIRSQIVAKSPKTLSKWLDITKKLVQNYLQQKNLSTTSNYVRQRNISTNFDDLPDELLVKIFENLPILERIQIEKINKSWDRLVPKCVSCLVVGKFPMDTFDIPLEDQIVRFEDSRDDEYVFDILCSFLKKNGHSLLKIYLNARIFESRKYEILIGLIADHCPVLTYFGFIDKCFSFLELPFNIISAIDSLLENNGNKFKGFHSNDLQMKGSMFEHLSNKITELTIVVSRFSDLKFLVEEFPFLEKLECVSYVLVPFSQHLRNLRNLKSFKMTLFKTPGTLSKEIVNEKIGLNLHSLYLENFEFTPISDLHLLTECNNLKNFAPSVLNDQTLDFIIEHMPNLETLGTSEVNDFSSNFFPKISNLKNLKNLRLLFLTVEEPLKLNLLNTLAMFSVRRLQLMIRPEYYFRNGNCL